MASVVIVTTVAFSAVNYFTGSNMVKKPEIKKEVKKPEIKKEIKKPEIKKEVKKT